MTDKEILAFCEKYDVELNVRYDSDRNAYHLRMQRGWLQINYIFSHESIKTSKGWSGIVKSVLDELERRLTSMEKEGASSHD